MAQQNLVIGAKNGGTGDTYFDAFTKVEANFTELYDSQGPENQVVVNELDDFPAAVAGVINLLPDTQYLIGSDVNIGTDTIAITAKSSIEGSGRLSASITYTGTGDMFTVTNGVARIERITAICSTGRFVNYTDNTDSLLVIDDCTVTCDRFGLFNSTGSNGSILRISSMTFTATTDGALFTGAFDRVSWLTVGMNVSAGEAVDLGVATFNSILLDTIGINTPAGTTFLKGAANNANLTALGVGQVISARASVTTGTMLSGITEDDAQWDFFHNNRIADTRPDGLLSIQGNATETVIAATGTPVKVAGTWVIEETSQLTGTTGGRLTYSGVKDVKLPIDYTVTMEPVSGTTIALSAYVAVNGTVVANSKAATTASSGNPSSVSIVWQRTFSTNDYVEVFVENNDTTSNIIVSSAISRVN